MKRCGILFKSENLIMDITSSVCFLWYALYSASRAVLTNVFVSQSLLASSSNLFVFTKLNPSCISNATQSCLPNNHPSLPQVFLNSTQRYSSCNFPLLDIFFLALTSTVPMEVCQSMWSNCSSLVEGLGLLSNRLRTFMNLPCSVF